MHSPYPRRDALPRTHPLLKRAGLPRIRFHDLRHTAATLLLRRAHPTVVSELLGHLSVSFTLDDCSHVLPDMQREATTPLDQALAEGSTEAISQSEYQ